MTKLLISLSMITAFFLFFQRGLRDISTTISADKLTVTVGSPMEITFAIHNGHKKKQKICRYMTPLEGLKGNIFEVRGNNGELLEYQGIMVKRGKPQKEDYVKVIGKGSEKVTIDLSEAYSFAEVGRYTIQFKGSEYLNKLPNSNTITIKVVE